MLTSQDVKNLESATKMANSRTITPYHFASATGETWLRAKAVLQRYARNGLVEELRSSRFRIPAREA